MEFHDYRSKPNHVTASCIPRSSDYSWAADNHTSRPQKPGSGKAKNFKIKFELEFKVTHCDVAYIDQRGQERTHYDQRPVGQGLRLCDSFDCTFDIPFNVRIKTKTIIIYPSTSGTGSASIELELLGNYQQ